LSPTNRLRVEEKYYLFVGDRAKAIAVDEQVLASGDSSLPVLSQLGELTQERRQLAVAERYERAALARAPTAYMFYANLAATLVEEGRIDDADSLLRVAAELLPPSWIIARAQIRSQYLRGQLDTYERMLDTARTSDDATVRRQATAMRRNLALVRGHLGEWSRMRAESNAMNRSADAALSLADLMEAPLIDFWIRSDTASAIRSFHDAVAERRLMPSQFLEVGSFYAITGRTDLARGFLTDFQAVSDTAERRRFGYLVHRLRGDITRAEGRIAESLDEIRKGDVREDGPVDGCAICLAAKLAVTFDHGQMTDSAIAQYERYVETPSSWHLDNDHLLLPRILERLGQLHESRDDREKAIHYYAEFAELWKTADPELQPRVAEARRRIRRLSAGTR
jgi:tetratricopeptide (TPR) repeat protein